jgi:hypothetical protein
MSKARRAEIPPTWWEQIESQPTPSDLSSLSAWIQFAIAQVQRNLLEHPVENSRVERQVDEIGDDSSARQVEQRACAYAVALLPADLAAKVTHPSDPLFDALTPMPSRARLLCALSCLDGLCITAIDRIRDMPKGRGTKTTSKPSTVNRDGRLSELTDTERSVYKVIASQPRGKGLEGKEIVVKVKNQGVALEETTLRRHVIPRLKALMGVRNSSARGGYYLPD